MKDLNLIAEKWEKQVYAVLDLKKISNKTIQELLKDTYEVLTEFCKKDLVPKEIGKILLNMRDFSYFASIMEENECGAGFYNWEEIHYIVKALEEGFFESKYSYKFPVLFVKDSVDNDFLFDLENDPIEKYFVAIQQARSIPI